METPKHILSENDLCEYENFLHKQQQSLSDIPSDSNDFLQKFLSKYIGSTVKAEVLFGNRIAVKYGILKDVNNSFLLLKTANGCNTILCTLNEINCITVIHNKNKRNF